MSPLDLSDDSQIFSPSKWVIQIRHLGGSACGSSVVAWTRVSRAQAHREGAHGQPVHDRVAKSKSPMSMEIIAPKSSICSAISCWMVGPETGPESGRIVVGVQELARARALAQCSFIGGDNRGAAMATVSRDVERTRAPPPFSASWESLSLRHDGCRGR